jgi:hypothetical protein
MLTEEEALDIQARLQINLTYRYKAFGTRNWELISQPKE